MHDYTLYFWEQKEGFAKFINKLYQKYRSFGRITGTIKMTCSNNFEVKALSRLFGNNYVIGSELNISVSKFIRIMKNSRFEDFNVEILVSEFLNIELKSTNEEKKFAKEKELEFYNRIITKNEGLGSIWLKDTIANKNNAYKLIHHRYLKNKESLEYELHNIVILLNNLPKERVILSIFASTFTNDPHYLDLDNSHAILFFYGLCFIDNINYVETRSDKIKLLSKYNLDIDSISNFVITYNLYSDKNYINAFAINREPLILNITNIINLNMIDGKNKKVFILENPSLLTEIINKKLDVSVIISDGFINASVYFLLDKLVDNHNTLYYNGDFDPEGLLIADNLKKRYQDKLILFGYDIDNFSNMTNIIDNKSRLKKLEKINSEELLDIKNYILANNKVIYQESNKEKILNWILNKK